MSDVHLLNHTDIDVKTVTVNEVCVEPPRPVVFPDVLAVLPGPGDSVLPVLFRAVLALGLQNETTIELWREESGPKTA